MTAHRTAVLVGAAPLLLAVWAAGPAAAHGAPTDPVSRVVACSPQGGQQARSAACRAAVASGIAAFDNLRLAGVDGRDRQVVPDGKLCSGGIAAYRGLDLARADWPSTRLTGGADMTLTYRSTIPHTGTFKLFLTKEGYDPTKPLKWSDLPSQPFATATDPALVNGAYTDPGQASVRPYRTPSALHDLAELEHAGHVLLVLGRGLRRGEGEQ